MTGDIDWKSVMGAFKEVGYRGIISVEYAHGKMPQKLMEDFIDLTYRAAEQLWLL
jgi:sugar phosphate isomerase/epimerase